MQSGWVSVFPNLNHSLIKQYEGNWSLKSFKR